MALKLIFNPFTSKLDWIDQVDTSAFAVATPRLISNGTTWTVPTNTQITHAAPIVTEAGGIGLTVGTATVTWVD